MKRRYMKDHLKTCIEPLSGQPLEPNTLPETTEAGTDTVLMLSEKDGSDSEG